MNSTAEKLGVNPKAFAGLAVLVVGTLFWALAFTGGIASFFSGSTTTVRADFASIEDVVPNDPVRVDGVQIGTVGGSTPDANGRGATLTLDLNSEAPKIYRNASAQIVWRTALGANDAVRIDPGTPSAGLLGDATIPRSQDTNQVELDQITQAALHGKAPQGMRTMLQQLAPAFRVSPATLNDDFNTLARIAPEANVGLGAMRGEIQDTDLQNLVKDSAQAAQALSVGASASGTRAFVEEAATLLSATAANPPNLATDITEADAALTLAPHIFALINTTAFKLDPLISTLNPSAPRVAPTLEKLHPVVTNLDSLLHSATPLLARLRPTVHSLAAAARVGVPVINALNPSLVRLENTILPGLDVRSPEEGGRPTYELAGGTIVNIGTLSHFFDSNGNLVNLTFGGNAFNQTSAGVLPCALDFSGKDLLTCETLSQALATYSTVGTSLLTGLRRQAGTTPLGAWASRAINANSAFAATAAKVKSLYPGLAKLLFTPHDGGAR